MSRIPQIIEALEAERADVQQRLEWLDGQIAAFQEHRDEHPATTAPPPRSRRRQTAKRASSRRATARSVKRDVAGEIIDHLKTHPNSTAGDVAKALNLNRNSVATRLSQLVKSGEIAKAERGYATPAVK